MMQWTFLKEPFKRSTLKIEAVKMFLKDKITYSKHQPPKVGSRELNNFNSYMKVCFRKMHQKLPLLELSVLVISEADERNSLKNYFNFRNTKIMQLFI